MEVPSLEAGSSFEPGRENARWSDREDVPEREHQRRDNDRNQNHRLEPSSSRQIGADHEESENGAERDGDQRHAGAEQEGRSDSDGEILVAKHGPVGFEPK